MSQTNGKANGHTKPLLVHRQPVAYGYGRASTDQQLMSPEIQKQTIERYYQQNLPDAIWGGFYCDQGLSAIKNYFLDRPAGLILDARMEKGDHIIFAKLDRGFRKLADFAKMKDMWEQRGVFIHFVDMRIDTSTMHGKLLAGVVALMAEFEGAMIRERTKADRAYRKSRGMQVNQHAGYGFKFKQQGRDIAGKKLPAIKVRDDKAREIMSDMFRLHESGWTETAIFWQMVKEGRRLPNGCKWNRQNVHNLITAERALRVVEGQASQELPARQPVAT